MNYLSHYEIRVSIAGAQSSNDFTNAMIALGCETRPSMDWDRQFDLAM